MLIIQEINPPEGRFKVYTGYLEHDYYLSRPLYLWGSPLALLATNNINETFKACSMLL